MQEIARLFNFAQILRAEPLACLELLAKDDGSVQEAGIAGFRGEAGAPRLTVLKCDQTTV
jgi:hypothetical protein